MAVFNLPEEEYFVSGHRACSGCGAAIALRLITKALGKNSIIVEATGCMEVVSTPYPETSWKLPWIHGAFENAAAIASGISEALKFNGKEDVKVIAIGGDGATYDIGFGHISGAFERGHNFCYICYENEAYMNTGIQRSSATPFAASTTTSPAGKFSIGKEQWKKDIMHILAAHNSEYLAQASIAFPLDAFKKIKKAIETKGPTFINLLAPCPTGWRYPTEKTIEIAKLAVLTGIFPLYEIINGKHFINMPTSVENLKPVEEYLKIQGRYRHLLRPERKEEELQFIQETTKKRFQILLDLASKGF